MKRDTCPISFPKPLAQRLAAYKAKRYYKTEHDYRTDPVERPYVWFNGVSDSKYSTDVIENTRYYHLTRSSTSRLFFTIVSNLGWYSDNFQGETFRPVIYLLPHRRGILIGYWASCNDEVLLRTDCIYPADDPKQAMDCADSLTRKSAEEERDFQAIENIRNRIEDFDPLNDDLDDLKKLIDEGPYLRQADPPLPERVYDGLGQRLDVYDNRLVKDEDRLKRREEAFYRAYSDLCTQLGAQPAEPLPKVPSNFVYLDGDTRTAAQLLKDHPSLWQPLVAVMATHPLVKELLHA